MRQPALFPETAGPEGFRVQEDLIGPQDEAALLADLSGLPLEPFQFHGFVGARRVTSFGWRYDFNDATFKAVEPIPDYLIPVRDRAAAFAGLAPEALAHALITEYPPGAAIGWHRDRPVFEDVVGVSLGAPCTFRFRLKEADGRWRRFSFTAQPRSAYLLRGPARAVWEHSIPPVAERRMSVTFRSLRPRGASGGAYPRG